MTKTCADECAEISIRLDSVQADIKDLNENKTGRMYTHHIPNGTRHYGILTIIGITIYFV